jgi:hypothetical protein
MKNKDREFTVSNLGWSEFSFLLISLIQDTLLDDYQNKGLLWLHKVTHTIKNNLIKKDNFKKH